MCPWCFDATAEPQGLFFVILFSFQPFYEGMYNSHRQYLLFLFYRLSQKGCLKPTTLFIVILNCCIQYVKEHFLLFLQLMYNCYANIQPNIWYQNKLYKNY